jgi:hypothetical protein
MIDDDIYYQPTSPTLRHMMFSGVMKHADTKRLYLACWSRGHGAADNELRTYRITNMSSVARLTNAVEADGTRERWLANLMMDQNTGHMYVAFAESMISDFIYSTQVDMRRSPDGGMTWEEIPWDSGSFYAEGGPHAIESIETPVSISAGDAGWVMAAWFETTGADESYWTNLVNRILLGPYTVRTSQDGGPEQAIVACTTGQPMMVEASWGPSDGSMARAASFPMNTMGPVDRISTDLVVTLHMETLGLLEVGYEIFGARSKAIGTITKKDEANKTITLERTRPGPGGDGVPFLPNEEIIIGHDKRGEGSGATSGSQPSSSGSTEQQQEA